MIKRCYDRYIHTLRMAYRYRGLSQDKLDATFPSFGRLEGVSAEAAVEQLFPGVRERLTMAHPSLAKTLLKKPKLRAMELAGHSVQLPLLNEQGVEWYGTVSPEACDFTGEHNLGLHEDAKVIYDFGGHQGVWAIYYALLVGPAGRVYSFEPSLINIEVSSMLFLINSVDNIVNFAAAVGAGDAESSGAGDMLIDFVSADAFEIVNLRNLCWDRADFLKMDIEGFEYDVITKNPWVFDLATNFHIEVHIPHLERRKLDYKKIMELIPFDQFDVFNHVAEKPVNRDTDLQGFCGLMMRRK